VNDADRLRYSRHLLLNEFGEEAQQRLLASRVLVVGAGGLGSASLLYLASAGVGSITVADGDSVDITNLQRQVIHTEASIGQPKAQSAIAAMRKLNSQGHFVAVNGRLSGVALDRAVAEHDLTVDCSDNFATRYAVNAACVAHRRPLVSGAAIRFDGQIAVFDHHRDSASPCYHCLFPADLEHEEERCAVMGVFAPLVGVVGTIQAQEVLKVLSGVGTPLTGRLLMVNALSARMSEVRVLRDPQCPVCVRPVHSQPAEVVN
jgi:molybdopterin-synthase adenylyltransferase